MNTIRYVDMTADGPKVVITVVTPDQNPFIPSYGDT